MSGERTNQTVHPASRFAFAFVMSIVAVLGLSIVTGSVGIAIAVGLVVFLVFGLEL